MGLVTDEDVQVAWVDFRRGYADPAGPGQPGGGTPAGLRAALEGYGSRLAARAEDVT